MKHSLTYLTAFFASIVSGITGFLEILNPILSTLNLTLGLIIAYFSLRKLFRKKEKSNE